MLASVSDMCKASLTNRVELCLAWSRMDVLSQSRQWCSFQACSAMADFSVSPCFVAAWCSLRQVSRLLFVSPTHVRPQFLHGIFYTTPDFLMTGLSMSFTLVSFSPRVLVVVNTVVIWCFLQTLLKSSPTPAT